MGERKREIPKIIVAVFWKDSAFPAHAVSYC